MDRKLLMDVFGEPWTSTKQSASGLADFLPLGYELLASTDKIHRVLTIHRLLSLIPYVLGTELHIRIIVYGFTIYFSS